ncbi:MAG: valine--tRNA ligase [Ferruginibacter sp.]
MELSKNFQPQDVESKWYNHWLKKNYFSSIPDHRPPFTLVIPPPNVTGVLHMGHTLNETVQDILVRRARMTGYNACWVPGSDHASIATEARVVAMLKEKGIDKNDLSREEFLDHAFQWKEKYGNIIYNQIARLGCSADWNRTTFTMDKHYYDAVIKVFVDLYNKGHIYRGARMINWDVVAKTALSDEEVEHKDVEGKMYYIQYSIFEQSQNGALDKEAITIATQRPETIMGDTAIAVNPNDNRYTHLIGKHAIIPLINKKIPIIFDEYVDPSFGTGALKVTPAHDINDYNLGLKHKLEIIETLNEDGTLSEAAQIYVGEERFTARKKIVKELTIKKFITKEEINPTRLGYSQRTGVVVEPRISTQWFVKMEALARPALDAVTSGEVKIHPGERFLATYKYWLENVRDWCISRQLWWGQQIPAWYSADGSMAVAETRELALQQFRLNNSEVSLTDLTQDEDVLDTWFSSWLWPMEVFKGISNPGNEEIKYYYPTTVLVTGQDIIFFWVARMLMAGMEYENQRPFSDVYFTGMVRDKQGRKMSKSLGNSPDLLELIDKYGADAVRFGIMISSPAGNDLLFDESSLEQGRNFNNKMWNAVKLVKMWEAKTSDSKTTASGIHNNGEGYSKSEDEENSAFNFLAPIITHSSGYENNEGDDFATAWFENRLNEASRESGELIAQFKLSEALKVIYSLIWDDFCSWYLEWIKPPFQKNEVEDAEHIFSKKTFDKTIVFFTRLMELLHPFMPFVTEEIYHQLKRRTDDLCVRQYQSLMPADRSILDKGKLLKEVISGIRDVRNKNQLKPKDKIVLHVQSNDKPVYKSIEKILLKQVNATAVNFTTSRMDNLITAIIGRDTFYVDSGYERNAYDQKGDMIKELQHLRSFLETVEKKLGNEKFVQNAKPEIIAHERKKQSDARLKIMLIEESLASIS